MTQRWTEEQAADWLNKTGWLVGCNFAPSTAGNQFEFWQAETFDPITISRELQWAADLGMNTVRVYLHHMLFQADAEGFFQRFEEFLTIADQFSITTIPVLFDGVWNPFPALGEQKGPKPRLHNSMWMQSPGAEVLYNESVWNELQPYVTTVLARYSQDTRIVAWDLFNEPDQVDLNTFQEHSRSRKIAASSGLMKQVFDWARSTNPSQPLTVGVWEFTNDECKPVDDLTNRIALAESDIISFHCYKPGPELTKTIKNLQIHNRPLLCTEWLARSEGSTVDLLDVFKQHGVGAVNWGLVDGRTQTRFPWRSWQEPMTDDVEWFHELLHADGTPYRADEAEIFRRLTGTA
jgi:hypothetical protein